MDLHYPRPNGAERMLTVWKYTLDAAKPETTFSVPVGSKLISAAAQHDDIVVYALCDQDTIEYTFRTVRVYGTGHNIDDLAGNLVFIGTVKLDHFWFHVFEVLNG